MIATVQKLILPLLLLATTHLTAQNGLPLDLPDSQIKPLRELVDDNMEMRLKKELQANPQWAQLIRDKKLAVGLVDLSNPYRVRFARVNGNEMMYAASLPKIAILLAAMDAIQKCELEETPEVTEDMNLMICYSNNQASTRMIDRLGYAKIEAVLTDPRYALFDEDYGGGLWVGKRYAASGERHPDPLRGLSHAATVSQVCRFYYLLAMGKLVNRERSIQMLSIMDNPALHHKFVCSLDVIAPHADLYRKSGSWKAFHCDSVLVWDEDPRRRYILVALAESPNGEQIIRDLVQVAEKVLRLQT
ncbi:MAG: serine hydrolase [Saprospiraceae bacterium]|nr:serine hydrolase [Saprospiraceae bacterium]